MTSFVTKRSEHPPGWVVEDPDVPSVLTVVEDQFWDEPVAIGDVISCRYDDGRWHFYKRKPL